MNAFHEGRDAPSIEDDFELYVDESRNSRDAGVLTVCGGVPSEISVKYCAFMKSGLGRVRASSRG